MSESYRAHVFAPENEPFPWRAARDELTRRFPEAAVDAPSEYDGLLVVLEDHYEIGIVAENDVARFVGECLLGASDGTLSDDVEGRLRSALATCTLRIEISGYNDMGGAVDHFNDWALATEVVENAVRGAITVDGTELE